MSRTRQDAPPSPAALAERAAEASGADECVVTVEVRGGAHLRWANNAVTASGHVHDHRVTVVSAVARRDGIAVGSVTGQADPGGEVDGLVEAADAAARSAPADPDATCPVGDRASPNWADPPAEAPAALLAPVAASLRSAVDRADAEGRLLYGYAERGFRTSYVASSTGLRLRHVQREGLLDLTVRGSNGAGQVWAGNGWTGSQADDDVAALHERLRDRLHPELPRAELPEGRYEVLLSPSCVADLMLHLYRAAGAGDAADGASPFADPGVGTRLTPMPLSLESGPGLPGLECAPFLLPGAADEFAAGLAAPEDAGLPLSPTEWISGGTLAALVQTRRTAARTGLPLTPWIGNLRLSGPPGGRTLPEMVAATDRAVLIDCVWYVRTVDAGTLLLTGLTRDGVHLVEHGEITAALPDLRFTESPVHLLRRVTEVGRTGPALPREWGDGFTRTAMPPLRVEGFPLFPSERATT